MYDDRKKSTHKGGKQSDAGGIKSVVKKTYAKHSEGADGGDSLFRNSLHHDSKPFDQRKRTFGDRPRPGKLFACKPVEKSESGERIAKRLARAGIASRRDAEELIAAGRVKVNGKVLSSPAFNVMFGDIIHLDGTEISPIERTRLFLFHKQSGLVTTNYDPEGRRTVFDVLPSELPRLMTVGRLDINTEGLLLLTNDGGLSRVLELPTTGWLRRYRVRVHGKIEQKQLDDLKDGIAVDGIFYGSVEATLYREHGSNAWIIIGLREGKNREVKNILGALGLEVNRLIRISYGPFQLGALPEGSVQEIKSKMLRDQLGERLIEESGANFDADIIKPFSNKLTTRHEDRRDDAPARAPCAARLEIGEGGLVKNRKRDRERYREDVLSLLSTKRLPFGGKSKFGSKNSDDREKEPFKTPGARKANVWMAPGARPQGANKTGKPRGDRSNGGAPSGKSGSRNGRG